MSASESIKLGQHDQLILGLCSALLVSLYLQHISAIGSVSYLFVLITFILSFLFFVTYTERKIYIGKHFTVLLIAFIIATSVSLIFNISNSVLLRYLVLITFTLFSILILPKVIPSKCFFYTASRLSAVLVCLGFLPYLGIVVEWAYIDLSLWGGRIYWNEDLSPITSIFSNPNALGIITVVGAISSFAELHQKPTDRMLLLIISINLIGLAFTNYRTGWVAFIIGACVYGTYIFGTRQVLTIATITGVSISTVLLLMMFSIIPGPTALTEMSLNNRRERWIGGFHALIESPWVGHGFGSVTDAVQPYTAEQTGNVHNSFVRVFVGYGILGGVLYTVFYLTVLLEASRLSVDDVSAVVFSMLVAFFFIQLFNDLTFIGVSFPSVTIALMIGYVLRSQGLTAYRDESCNAKIKSNTSSVADD